MEKVFYKSLEYALGLKGDKTQFDSIRSRIDKIVDYEEIKKISKNPEDELFVWLPAIVFNMFGYDMYRNCDLNIEDNTTYVLFRPNSSYDFSVIDTISEMNMNVLRYKYKFTSRLVASLYGGFPWFHSYYQTCVELKILNEIGYAYKISSKDGRGCVKKIVEMKNRYRCLHPENTITLPLENEEYDGIIHSFHSPNCIENKIHCIAIEKEIVDLGVKL